MHDYFIAVDFDGTCVRHEFPEIGSDIGAVPALKALVKDGWKLILHTMRAHPSSKQNDPSLKTMGLTPTSRDTLGEAEEWFRRNGIPLYASNDNPSQHSWTESKKVYAHIYIDDAALGVPLVDPNDGGRPYVDWKGVMLMLVERGLVSKETYSEYVMSIIDEDGNML